MPGTKLHKNDDPFLYLGIHMHAGLLYFVIKVQTAQSADKLIDRPNQNRNWSMM